MSTPIRVPVRAARRLAVLAQRLAGPLPRRRPDAAAVLDVAQALGCLQLDPIATVARSHLLVLQSRLGAVGQELVDHLAYDERSLFEYWAHEASYVCTRDLPVHAWSMRTFPRHHHAWVRRTEAWVTENAALRGRVLERLQADGPLTATEIDPGAAARQNTDGWPGRSDASRMLDVLWLRGEVLVSRRRGGQRLWDLPERCLPPGVGTEDLSDEEAVRRAALRSLRALGVARTQHVKAHFLRHRYPALPAAMARLAADGLIEPVEIEELPGRWWVHAEDADTLRALAAREQPFAPRTVLLSPFDNLLCDRARTEQLFGFFHRLEIYVPRAKRRWGYYVLPILHGDRLIGRADLAMDRDAGVLRAHAVYAEPGTARAGRAVRRALERLAAWQGAERFEVGAVVPDPWREALLA